MSLHQTEEPVSLVDSVNTQISSEKKSKEKSKQIDPKPEKTLNDTPKTHNNNENGLTLRPRRSCTLAPRSYKFESPSKDKKKKQKDTKESPENKSIIDISDEDSRETTPDTVKLASIFNKKIPKPAVDPEVTKARQDFLMSGLPETIRLEIDRQKEFEEFYTNEIPWFPIVSHVTQSLDGEDRTEVDWNLSKIKLRPEDLKEDFFESFVSSFKLGVFEESELERIVSKKPELSWNHVKDRKAHGRKLKLLFETFPTYKCFHQLHEKQKNAQEEICSNQLFTEKYKPLSSDQFLINTSPVASLKRFLSVWKDFKVEASNDDFEDSSRDSRCSTSSSVAFGSNVILLYGPSGSGKTSSVLALANEMHFNVLEINAGAKRTGKKMLQELLEATQSHQLRKERQEKEEKKLKHLHRKNSDNTQEKSNKMSLILIEDADLIFEQDDGFISGISQLVSISKRPVILTAINSSLPHLSSYLNQNSIEFHPASPLSASKFLTVMCLAENYIVSDHEIRKLYERNNSDVRKTILQLQFYFQTGGDLKERFEQTEQKNSPINLDEALIEVIPMSEDDMQEIDDENSKFSTISFEDHGIGAPIEHQHSQFNKFFGSVQENPRQILTGTTLDEILQANEFISSVHTLKQSFGEVSDRLASDLNEEVLEILSCDTLIKSSLRDQRKDEVKVKSR